jgi:hypothetical protein
MTSRHILTPQPILLDLGEAEDGSRITKKIHPFKVGKTLRVFTLLSDVVEAGDVASLFVTTDAQADSQSAQAAFFAKLLTKIPHILRTAKPKLLELVALVIIPDKKLVEAEENGTDDELLKAEIRWVKDNVDNDGMFKILEAGIDLTGIDSIRKNVTSLLKKFQTPKTTE